jgi:diacylglycerol kinase family enzyme
VKTVTKSVGFAKSNVSPESTPVKILLIVNPSASGVTARGRVMIQNALAANHELTVAETKRRGHATRLAQGAASTGTELVISLGGDGTVNEVANGLVRTHTSLAVLPGGSTNVFARTLGLVNEPVEATGQLLEAIGRSAIRRVGLGNVNGRFFLFHVGMGYDAAVVEQVERRGNMKRWLGHALFGYAAVDTWARKFDRRTPPFWISFDGDESSSSSSGGKRIGASKLDGFFAIAMNTDPYTYLGSRPLSLSKEATLDNPLSLVTLKQLNLVGTVGAVVAAVRGGDRLKRAPNVDIRTNLQSFTVHAHRPFPWQVDGDHLGDANQLNFSWEPEVLDLVTP